MGIKAKKPRFTFTEASVRLLTDAELKAKKVEVNERLSACILRDCKRSSDPHYMGPGQHRAVRDWQALEREDKRRKEPPMNTIRCTEAPA